MVHLTFAAKAKVFSTRKVYFELEAWTLVWKPNAMVNYMVKYDCGKGFYCKGR